MSGATPEPGGELVLYRTEDGGIRIECRFDRGTIWLSQALLAELYKTSIPNVISHIQNILAEGELSAEATTQEYLVVHQKGGRQVRRTVKHYRLEMILAVC